MKYLKKTYRTISGTSDFIDIGNHGYGEWIVYESLVPKFHINCFRENSESDSIIKTLIENENQTIENILTLINKNLRKKLTLGKRPIIALETKRELIELELNPIPTEWLKKNRNEV